MEKVDVNQVEELSKTISNYGVAVVVCAVFLLIVIIAVVVTVKRMNENSRTASATMEKLINEVVQQNKTLVDVLVSRPDTKHGKREEREVNEQTVLNHRISEVLHTARETIKADRMDVFIFSNGQESLDHSFRFLKFSRMFSAVRSGSTARPLDEIPISYLPHFFDKLSTQDQLDYWDIRELKTTDPITFAWMKNSGGRAVIAEIIQEGEVPTGFVVALWEGDITDSAEREMVINGVDEFTTKVGVLVSQ